MSLLVKNYFGTSNLTFGDIFRFLVENYLWSPKTTFIAQEDKKLEPIDFSFCRKAIVLLICCSSWIFGTSMLVLSSYSDSSSKITFGTWKLRTLHSRRSSWNEGTLHFTTKPCWCSFAARPDYLERASSFVTRYLDSSSQKTVGAWKTSFSARRDQSATKRPLRCDVKAILMLICCSSWLCGTSKLILTRYLDSSSKMTFGAWKPVSARKKRSNWNKQACAFWC